MIIRFKKMNLGKVYHGTCKAFVVYALQNNNLFGGPEISYTPDLAHAKMFANSWATQRGRSRLKEFFGAIPEEYSQGVIIEISKEDIKGLKKTMDAGAIEFVGKGPIELNENVGFKE